MPRSSLIESLESRTLMSVGGTASDSTVRIPVLLYHGIGLNDVITDASQVKQSQFEAQMDWLAQKNFHTISLATFKAWQLNPSSVALPERPFMVFFDDGNDTD